jgi:hypothetical protein
MTDQDRTDAVNRAIDILRGSKARVRQEVANSVLAAVLVADIMQDKRTGMDR